MRKGKETETSTTARLDKNSNMNMCHSTQGCCFIMNASINLHYKRSQKETDSNSRTLGSFQG